MSISEKDRQYLNRVANHTLLTKEEEVECARVINDSSENPNNRHLAVEKLIIHNQKWVIKQAHIYNRLAPSIPVMDFFGDGNVGLIKAAERYNPAKFSTRFSTFCTNWIKLYMRRSISRIGHVTVPYYLRQLQSQYFTILESGETNDNVIMKRLGIDETILTKIRGCEVRAVFLDAVNENGQSLSDVIADEIGVTPDVGTGANDLFEELNSAVEQLDEREQYIIRHRLLTNEVITLEALSKEFKLTKERIRQIQVQALNKLKIILEKKGMAHYVNAISSH